MEGPLKAASWAAGQGELPGLGSHHVPWAVPSCAGLGAETAPGREGTVERRLWEKEKRKKPRPSLQGRALLNASASAQACRAGISELQAAPVCREGERAWLEGAWLLTSTEEQLASKSLSLPILPTALSHTTALWQLVKVSSIWEERNCRCALRAGTRTSRSSTAGVLAGHVQSLWPGR